MKLRYYVKGQSFDIDIKWFTESCLLEDHEIYGAIVECAKHYYKINGTHDNILIEFPVEIALCRGNREIGRKTVEVFLEPAFECV